MKITDIPEYHDRKNVLALSKDTPVEKAAAQMKQHHYGAVVVVDRGKVAGIFTERDLLNKIIAEGLDYKKMTLKDVMTTPVKCAHEADQVVDLLRRMSQGRFRHMPVIDAHKKLVGLVSQGDFVALTWPMIFDQFKARTQKQFFNYTQLWMMVIVILAYFTIVPLLIS